MLNKNNYTPDVLDCLANLSNDEVFTPPSVVNMMLDALPKEIFESKKTTFLDPFTKSGVFLREITKRLLESQIPNYKNIADEIERITKEAIQDAVRSGELDLNDKEYEEKARNIGNSALKSHPESAKYRDFEVKLQEALDHILKEQVFGIAITELTAQLARRSLYCSKDASGKYSVSGSTFGTNSDGNIRFVPMKHKWSREMNKNRSFPTGTTCVYCGAVPQNFARPEDLESHAYEFIHKDINEIKKEFNNMEFTVICGNPPYQLNDGGGDGSSAKPIYHHFIEQAKRLNPKYLTMIVPARWYSGGKGLDDFRSDMLHDDRISVIHDFPETSDVFPGLNIRGGICYFLFDRDHHGNCLVVNHKNSETNEIERPLLEENVETFIRYNMAIPILKKVQQKKEPTMDTKVSSRLPFGINSDFSDYVTKEDKKHSVILYRSERNKNAEKRVYIDPKYITKNVEWKDKMKVLVSKASPGGDEYPHAVITAPVIAEPNSVCTETYLIVDFVKNKKEADNLVSYMNTKFFRFMMSLVKNTQNISKSVFCLTPIQEWTKPWTDEELYKKYKLTQQEIDFIESMVKPME